MTNRKSAPTSVFAGNTIAIEPARGKGLRPLALFALPLLAALTTLVLCLLLPPTFTAEASVTVQPSARPWDKQDSLNRAPIPSLSQYAALLQSRRVADRLIDQFMLQKVYDADSLSETRDRLAHATRLGAVDGLMVIQVSDRFAWRAADLANQYVTELQLLLDELRVEKAHAGADKLHREAERVEQDVRAAHASALDSRLEEGQLQLEPGIASKQYLNLQESLNEADMRLTILRGQLHDGSIDIQQQAARTEALKNQLHQTESGNSLLPTTTASRSSSKFAQASRDVRRLELELLKLRQEAMKVEADAGLRVEALLRVDRAHPPDRPSKPVIPLYMGFAWAATLICMLYRAWRRDIRAAGRSISAPMIRGLSS